MSRRSQAEGSGGLSIDSVTHDRLHRTPALGQALACLLGLIKRGRSHTIPALQTRARRLHGLKAKPLEIAGPAVLPGHQGNRHPQAQPLRPGLLLVSFQSGLCFCVPFTMVPRLGGGMTCLGMFLGSGCLEKGWGLGPLACCGQGGPGFESRGVLYSSSARGEGGGLCSKNRDSWSKESNSPTVFGCVGKGGLQRCGVCAGC